MNKSAILGILCVVTLLMGCKKEETPDPQPPHDDYLQLTLNSSATESKLTEAMLQGASKIKITGSINATDFKVLRSHKELEYLNLGAAIVVGKVIVGYNFNEETKKYEPLLVEGNAIPYGAFGKYDDFEASEVKPGTSVDTSFFDDFAGKGQMTQPSSDRIDKTVIIEEHKRIKSIILPRNITHIGRNAFANCETLTEPVEFPSTLLNIMDFAFYGCVNMKGEFKFPTELNVIGNSSFHKCASMTGTLTIPKNITIIYVFAFGGCEGITELKMHDKVTLIGASAFAGMKKLTKLNLPKELWAINFSAFSGCSGLKGDLTLPDGFEIIMDRVFLNCSNLDGTLTLNEELKEIKDFAFEGANFKTIIAKWSENGNPIPSEWNPKSSFWFPKNFEVSAGKSQYVIYIPKGELEYYTVNFCNPDGSVFYNFEEVDPVK